MKVTGIIAEYNPFHNGHKYQIEEAKKNSDYVIVAMSGDFTQRGEPAICDKYLRANMALMCGADLVLELPVSYATSDAKRFAMGGVSLLSSIGVVDELSFGIEPGCDELIFRLASFLSDSPASYQAELRDNLKSGLSYPSARASALGKYFEESEISLLSGSNMILGLEYLSAINCLNSKITPVPITRHGAAYNDTLLCEDGPSSASAIRTLLYNGCSDNILSKHMPECCIPLISNNILIHTDDFSQMLHYKLVTSDSFSEYLDVSESFSDRIIAKRNEFTSFSAFADILKTKNITHTSINRLLTHILLNIKSVPPVSVPYARILGFNKNSTEILSEIKKKSNIAIISKLADAKPDECLTYDIKASEVYNAAITAKTGIIPANEYQSEIVKY